jgi:hypothetical protein
LSLSGSSRITAAALLSSDGVAPPVGRMIIETEYSSAAFNVSSSRGLPGRT